MSVKIDYETKLDDFQKIVVFVTADYIKRNFKSLDDYFNCESKFKKPNTLHIENNILLKLTKLHDKRYFENFLERSTHLFTFHRHVTRTYISGKIFNMKSWFEVNPEILKEMFSDEKKYLRIESDYYTSRQHKLVDKLIFRFKKGDYSKTKT